MGLTEILHNLLHATYGRDVRQSLHDGVKIATDTANKVKEAQEQLDNKFDEQIKNMTLESPSDAEIVAARTKANGTTYDTLAKRLEADDGKTEFAAVVADRAHQMCLSGKIATVKSFSTRVENVAADSKLAISIEDSDCPKIGITGVDSPLSTYPVGIVGNSVSSGSIKYMRLRKIKVGYSIDYELTDIADSSATVIADVLFEMKQ